MSKPLISPRTAHKGNRVLYYRALQDIGQFAER
jgi:hypothetical protein